MSLQLEKKVKTSKIKNAPIKTIAHPLKKLNLALNPIKSILFSQPKPEGANSPYFNLVEKYNVNVDFHSFIRIEGIDKAEFKLQKINITHYSAIIFTSRNAIDHFFKLVGDLKIKISPDVKYFCLSESVALYLQKFILYRKRKVFFADESDIVKWQILLQKHASETFLFPYSNIEYKELLECLDNCKIKYKLAYMYKILSNDIKEIVLNKNYDIICFFTQGGVKSLFENIPNYIQDQTLICVFGNNTSRLAENYGLKVNLKVPSEKFKSVYDALENLLSERNKIKR